MGGKYNIDNIKLKMEQKEKELRSIEDKFSKGFSTKSYVDNIKYQILDENGYHFRATDGIATLDGKKINISFKYDSNIVDIVRQLAGRKYNPETKSWTASLCLMNVIELDYYGFELDNNLKDFLHKYDLPIAHYDISNIRVPDGLSLMDFQKNTIQFIEEHHGRVLISLDCGLGKSVVTSTYINNHKDIKPIIIVVPATLKYNWRNELNKWVSRKLKIEILEGKTPHRLKKTTDVYIINYDILSAWQKELIKIKPQLMVCDEAHYAKSRDSQRGKACVALSKKVEQVILLTGTPMINRTAELYNLIKMVDTYLFDSFMQFGQRYCGAEFNGFGWEYKGSSNVEELHLLLSNIMYRKKKEEVLTELPPKTYTFIPLSLTNKREYEKATNSFFDWVKENRGVNVKNKASYPEMLGKMAVLRQLAVKGALKESIEWLDNFIESTEEKVVVFAIHRDIINTLVRHFGDKCVKIDGSVKTGETRQQIVDKFQNDDSVKVFIGNIQAASEGITLTASSTVVFLEMPWSPSNLQQCCDRCHRIGQKDSVKIYYLLAENTVEMTLAEMIDKKKSDIMLAVDGEEMKEEDMLMDLIHNCLDKKVLPDEDED